ncbi:Rrf2 family transcriptional regulator [bacterium]|nr:Rrf2 family transcriptional regulator [bacterium]
MLTQTSESAIRALIYLAIYGGKEPTTPRQIAEKLSESPSYMAKITRMLAKANILRSHRGAAGGVSLSRAPEDITLLEIVEACQGLLVANYCEGIKGHPIPACAFHEAMVEVHEATLEVLSRWTLEKLATRPSPTGPLAARADCRIGIPFPDAPEPGL